jgi:hypothetical protein
MDFQILKSPNANNTLNIVNFQISNNELSYNAEWNNTIFDEKKSSEIRNINIKQDLQQIIDLYSEDCGHIVLAVNPEFSNDYIWVETTRLTATYKINPGDSYTSYYRTRNQPDIQTSDKSKDFPPSSVNSVLNHYFGGQYNFALVSILTPYKNCKVEDCVAVVRICDNTKITIDGEIQDYTSKTPINYKDYLHSWLPITFSQSNSISFTVTANTNANIYLSSDIGVLNRSVAKNGQTVTINTFGLSNGETVTIKAGYKFWQNHSKWSMVVDD